MDSIPAGRRGDKAEGCPGPEEVRPETVEGEEWDQEQEDRFPDFLILLFRMPEARKMVNSSLD